MTFSLVLPLPPSANASYRNVSGKGRAKTKAYKNWRTDAVKSIWAQVRADKRVGGPTAVTIYIPVGCALDLDNTIKPILDALVQSRRIDDDRNVWSILAFRSTDDKGNARIIVDAEHLTVTTP